MVFVDREGAYWGIPLDLYLVLDLLLCPSLLCAHPEMNNPFSHMLAQFLYPILHQIRSDETRKTWTETHKVPITDKSFPFTTEFLRYL